MGQEGLHVAGGTDASFAIDIAASMTGADHTLAQMDALTAKLASSGKSAEHFQQAIRQVSTDLDGAKRSAELANEALGEGNDVYRELERAADKSAKAAERAAKKNGGVVPPDAAARAAEASMQLEHYAQTLGHLEREAKSANATQAKLTGTLGNLRKLSGHVDKSLGGSTQAMGDLREAISATGGPVGQLASGVLAPVQAFKKLSAGMGESKAMAILLGVGAAAAAVGVALLTVAVIAGTVAIASWAVGLADGTRAAALNRDALAALHPEIGAVRDQYAGITDATGATGERLDALSKSLIDAKVSAEDLPDALRAAATAEAALGQGGAADFIADIKKGKLAVGEFADDVDGKFGGIVAQKMRGLDAQGAKFKRNFAGLFDGLNIEPVLEAARIVAGFFDATSVSGQAITFLFETVFQPLIDGAEDAAYVVEAFALGFLIGATKLYIGLKPVFKAIGDFFGFEDDGLSDTLDFATKAGELMVPVFVGLAAVIGTVMVGAVVALAAVLGPLIASAAVAAAPFIAAGLAIAGLAAAVYQAYQAVKEIDFGELGSQLIAGLVAGISSGAAAVVGAMRNVVMGAVNAAKEALGIHSPSDVTRDVIGAPAVAGIVEAYDDGATEVAHAMTDMVEPPESPVRMLDSLARGGAPRGASSASSAAAAPSGGGDTVINFNGPVNFHGVKDAPSGLQDLREFVVRAFEGVAVQVGGRIA